MIPARFALSFGKVLSTLAVALLVIGLDSEAMTLARQSPQAEGQDPDEPDAPKGKGKGKNGKAGRKIQNSDKAALAKWQYPKAATNEVEQIDPREIPDQTKKAMMAKFHVWIDNGTWHIAAYADSRQRSFTGTIQVLEGQITSHGSGSLEQEQIKKGKVANKNAADYYNVSPKPAQRNPLNSNRNVLITFKFNSMARGKDELSFSVSPPNAQVRFDLKMDGSAIPKQVFIGGVSSNPHDNPFVLEPR